MQSSIQKYLCSASRPLVMYFTTLIPLCLVAFSMGHVFVQHTGGFVNEASYQSTDLFLITILQMLIALHLVTLAGILAAGVYQTKHDMVKTGSGYVVLFLFLFVLYVGCSMEVLNFLTDYRL